MEAEVTTRSGGKLEMPRVTLDPSGLEESNEDEEGDYQHYDDDYQEAENFIPDTDQHVYSTLRMRRDIEGYCRNLSNTLLSCKCTLLSWISLVGPILINSLMGKPQGKTPTRSSVVSFQTGYQLGFSSSDGLGCQVTQLRSESRLNFGIA